MSSYRRRSHSFHYPRNHTHRRTCRRTSHIHWHQPHISLHTHKMEPTHHRYLHSATRTYTPCSHTNTYSLTRTHIRSQHSWTDIIMYTQLAHPLFEWWQFYIILPALWITISVKWRASRLTTHLITTTTTHACEFEGKRYWCQLVYKTRTHCYPVRVNIAHSLHTPTHTYQHTVVGACTDTNTTTHRGYTYRYTRKHKHRHTLTHTIQAVALVHACMPACLQSLERNRVTHVPHTDMPWHIWGGANQPTM